MSKRADQLREIADTHGLPFGRVMEAVKDLGHTDGQKIKNYLDELSFAVTRKFTDKNGVFRSMTRDEVKEYLIRKYA